jgi:hypothetical protein
MLDILLKIGIADSIFPIIMLHFNFKGYITATYKVKSNERKSMSKQEKIAAAIKEIVCSMMDRVMDNVLCKDPFLPEKHRAAKPLYAALVPDEIFKGAHFERRFVTPFGSVWEKLALVVAKERHGHCVQGHTLEGCVGEERLRRIQEVLNSLEHSRGKNKQKKPNWEEEIRYITEADGTPVPVSLVCDLYIESEETNKKYAFELKGPLPNSDQTKVSKEKMF